MRITGATWLFSLLLLGGCPQAQSINSSAVTAEIAYSSSRGGAPLMVSFSAKGSASRNGGALTYAWDFDDGATSDQVVVTHVFEDPGRYIVRLRVTDQAGEQDVDALEVRAHGSGAVAVIGAEPTSGPAPLWVQFDGTVSDVPDDTILDYYWDFGDGVTSRDPKPRHRFNSEGEYTVTLSIVTAGGLKATTSTIIPVSTCNASLLFAGSSFATLPIPLAGQGPLSGYTLEAWVKAESAGGILATLGEGALAIELRPAADTIRLEVSGVATEATAGNLTGTWRHVAVVYDSIDSTNDDAGGDETEGAAGGDSGEGENDGGEEGTTPDSGGDTGNGGDGGNGEDEGAGNGPGGGPGVCTLYLDGVPLATTAATHAITADRVIIGSGMAGRIAEARFWASARSSLDIGSTWNQRLSGAEPNLLGHWPLDDGSGQSLRNTCIGGVDGTLGASDAVEDADPGWSPEGPPL